MTNTQRAAMQQALEALVQADSRDGMYSYADEIAALSQALAEPVGEPVPVGEVVAYTDNRLQFKRIRGYDGAIAELPDGAKVYASPPAEHLCKWPTCQTEVYQKNLADQIAQELAGKPPAEVPLLTDDQYRSEFEAFVNAELGDVAVTDQGRYISPKIQNYWRVWQAAIQKAGIK